MGASWYFQRLKAMTPAEVAYRVSQKALQRRERKAFADRVPVHAVKAYGDVPSVDLSRLGLNYANDDFTTGSDIELLGPYTYADYKTCWHATFQAGGEWPVKFAHDYNFGEEGVPGDIRTNWELNRHYQFTLLAKSFFATGDSAYLDELGLLFASWNDANPFMWGPEWASPMESAIRLVNWLVAACFLESAQAADERSRALAADLCSGAYVMAANVCRHYSCYSSANNHTIVEASGVAIAAVVFGQEAWLDEALALLGREVALQTWPDGVNKEQALHYQLFVMEALCLVSHVLRASGSELSEPIADALRRMAHYAAACRVGEQTCIEFGDDDEGIVFNPCGRKPFYSGYVLALASLEVGTDVRWSDELGSYEQLRWLFSPGDVERVSNLPLFRPARVETFPQGGVTIARVADGRVVLAFDHGPLGFGALAAHGHADALSVQLYVDGRAVLVDPGTYVYNGNRAMRDLFRSTAMHNAVCVGGKNQSEDLGPFLWGRKASVSGFSLDDSDGALTLSAFHDGYSPATHKRTIVLDDSILRIVDEVDSDAADAFTSFHLSANGSAPGISLAFSSPEERCEFEYSPAYGRLAKGTEIKVQFKGRLTTEIHFDKEAR